MTIRFNSKYKRLLAIIMAFAVVISSCGINILVNADDSNVLVWNSGDDTAHNSISKNYVHWTVELDSTVSPYGNSYHINLDTGKGASEPSVRAKGITFDNNELAEQSALAFWIKVPEDSAFNLYDAFAFNIGNTYTASNMYSGTRTFVNTKTDEIFTASGAVNLKGFEGYVLYDLKSATIGTVNAQQYLKENGFSRICMYLPAKVSTPWECYLDNFCFVKDVDTFIEDVAPNAEIPNNNIEVWNAGEDTANDSIRTNYSHWVVAKDSLVSPHGDSYHVSIEAGKGAFWGVINAKGASFDKEALSQKEGLAFWIKVPENVNYGLNNAVEFNTNDAKGNDYSGTKTFINTKTGEVTTAEDGYNLTNFEGYVIYDLKNGVINNVRKDNVKTTDSMSAQDFLKTYGFTKWSVYVPRTGSVDIDWYLDNFCFIKDVDAFIEETVADALVSVAPPTANPESGYVGKGTKVSLSAEDGCDIYYTVDGTKPTTSSAKFDPQSPIEVNSSMMITAIAVKNGKASSVAMFSYGVIDPDSQNTVVVNDGSDLSKLTFYPENAFAKASEEGIAPNGSAYSINAQIKQTATLLNLGFEKRDADWMAAQDAFSMYVRVPKGMSFNYVSNLNSEGWYFTGTIATYNIVTGEFLEYSNARSVTLSDFEGYLIYKLSDATVNTVRYKENSDQIPVSEFITKNGFSRFVFYIGAGNMTKYNGYDIVFDHCAFSFDYNALKAELFATPLIPAAPNADVVSGTVENGTFVYLTAQEGADIYYTLDGTIPTVNSTKYALISLGNDNGYFSPIAITADTVLRAVAVKDGVSSSVSSYKYELELPYEGPEDIVVNDGSGEGNNIVSWNDGTRLTDSIVDDVSPDGAAIKFTPVDNDKISSHVITFNADTENLEQVHKTQALSFYTKIPDLGEGKTISLSLRINNQSTGYAGKIYAVSNDGEVQIFNDGKGIIRLNNFEGTIIYTTNGQYDVTTNWEKGKSDWKSYIKLNGLKKVGFIVNLPVGDNNTEKDFVFDTISVHYNLQSLFEKYDMEALLAEYDIGTVENSNMIVTNDLSNAKLNGALHSKSDNITAEFSNYSPDDRNIKLTFGENASEISFFSYTKEAEATIADGLTFWVEVPKGTGDVNLGVKIAEGNEKFQFSDSKFYFLIDKDGYISRHEGKLTLPDGFRGWIILPNDNVHFDETSQFQNGTLEYNNISNITVAFENKNNHLKDKYIYIDDISFYVDFQRLVLSRAIAWKK